MGHREIASTNKLSPVSFLVSPHFCQSILFASWERSLPSVVLRWAGTSRFRPSARLCAERREAVPPDGIGSTVAWWAYAVESSLGRGPRSQYGDVGRVSLPRVDTSHHVPLRVV